MNTSELFNIGNVLHSTKPVDSPCSCFFSFLQIATTELLADSDEGTLLVSTLDGALHAVAKSSGAVKWVLKDGLYCSVWFLVTSLRYL